MAATLEENMAAYEAMKDRLEDAHFLKWAVFYEGELAGIYDDSQDACLEAVQRYGRGPYHIRMIGRENLQKKKEMLEAALVRRRRNGKG